MKIYAILTWTAFVVSMAALGGCQTRSGANDGSGYARVNLKPGSVDYLIVNDRPAAETIAGNNRQCARDAQCRK